MFFVLMHRITPEKETLVEYYIRSYGHLIPSGVEIWEFDETARKRRVRLPSAILRING
jgi:hypothetical protein